MEARPVAVWSVNGSKVRRTLRLDAHKDPQLILNEWQEGAQEFLNTVDLDESDARLCGARRVGKTTLIMHWLIGNMRRGETVLVMGPPGQAGYFLLKLWDMAVARDLNASSAGLYEMSVDGWTITTNHKEPHFLTIALYGHDENWVSGPTIFIDLNLPEST
jgi:hypothetical protein